MNRPVTIPAAIDYPCSDGQPVAESGFQLIPLLYAITALRTHFRDRDRIYVSGDMFVYFKEGDPRSVVAPDVFVVIGAPNHTRVSYKLWEEPKAPDFVLEITSRSTRAEDQGRKREVYASLGVGEYWLFDPTGDWLAPRLKGFRLHGGEYRPLPSLALVHGGLSLHSEALGLDVRQDEDGRLRLPRPGERRRPSSPRGDARTGGAGDCGPPGGGGAARRDRGPAPRDASPVRRGKRWPSGDQGPARGGNCRP